MRFIGAVDDAMAHDIASALQRIEDAVRLS